MALAAAGPGCGTRKGDGATVTVRPGERLDVVMDEYRFEPQDVRTRVGTLRVRARNAGGLAHNWRILYGKRELGGTETFQAGGTRSATIRLEQPGTFRIVCTVGNHEELGMGGRLTVGARPSRPKAPAAPR